MFSLKKELFPWAPRVSHRVSPGAMRPHDRIGEDPGGPAGVASSAAEHPSTRSMSCLALHLHMAIGRRLGSCQCLPCSRERCPRTRPLCHVQMAPESAARPPVSALGGTLLLCRFTRVVKINLTLLSPTGEKVIEVLFLIYEKP